MQGSTPRPRSVLLAALACVVALAAPPATDGQGAGDDSGPDLSLAVAEAALEGLRADSFLENAGQLSNRDVLFYTISGDVQVGFAESTVLVKIVERASARANPDAGRASHLPQLESSSSRGVLVRIAFEGSHPVRPEGVDQLPHRSHYFLGSDPAGWRTDVAHYGQVVYQDLYDGVDVAYRVGTEGLKYDITVHPGADPGAIAMAYEGVEGLEADDRGLVVRTVLGDLFDSIPRSYQGREDVACRFDPRTPFSYGFDCGGWDASRPLVIDPLLYSTFLGGGAGSGDDSGSSIAVDASGSAYVTGVTQSMDFPTTPGAFDITYAWWDAFVAKLNATGSGLLYSTYLGGDGYDVGSSIAVDASGSAYVTGTTQSADFPTTPGAFDTTQNDGGFPGDTFVAKLNASGSGLLYSTFLGGGAREGGSSIAVDASGSAYVTGTTQSVDFPTTPGALDTSYDGDGTYLADAFVAKLNATGSGLLYSTFLGGGGGFDDQGLSIAVDASGSAYVTGVTDSTDFPTTPGAFDTTHNGANDAFVATLNATGSGLLYSTFLGGGSRDEGLSIAVDASGSAYVTGVTNGFGSMNFPTTPGAFDTSLDGGVRRDAFVAKLNATGSRLLYSTFLGGGSYDYGYSIAVDASGSAYVTGWTDSTDFPTTPRTFDTSLTGYSDAFVTKLNASGSDLHYSTFLGGGIGGGRDWGNSIVVDASSSVYVTGATSSTDFPTTTGAFDTTHNRGVQDVFVTKLSPASPTTAITSHTEGQWVNTGTINVAGTAVANPPATGVTEVWVSCDDAATWAMAVGTTFWTYANCNLIVGRNTIRAYAVDDLLAAGAHYVLTVNADLAPPAVLVSSPISGSWSRSVNIPVSGTAADAGSGLDRVDVSCDGGLSYSVATGTTSWTQPCAGLGEGASSISARAFDNVGWESVRAILTVNVDLTPPAVTITSPEDSSVVPSQPITVTGDAADAGIGLDRVEVSCDGGTTWSLATGTSSWTIECSLVVGPNALRTRAFDLLGWESLHDFITVTYAPNDVSAPLLVSPADAAWTRANAPVLAWSFQDPDAGDAQAAFRVDVDGDAAFGSIDQSSGDVVSSVPSWTPTPLADGCSYWRVRTQDSRGAWSPFSVLWQLCVDTLGPATRLSLTGASFVSEGRTYVTSSALVSLAATDGGSGLDSIRYRGWDGLTWSPWATYVAPIPLPPPDGVRHIVYYATDALGNMEKMNQATFLLDDSPPTTTLSIGTPQVPIGGALYVSAATTLSLAAVDGGSPPVGPGSTEYQVDGGVWTPYFGPFGVQGEGAHLVAYRSPDLLGNVENSNAFAVIVDGTAPTATLEIGDPRYAAANVYVTSRTPITLAATDEGALPVGVALVEYRLNSGVWTPYAGGISLSGPDRTNVLEYRASDLLGNIATGSVDVVVDDTPPATEIRPASGPYTTRSSFVVSASDAGSGVARTEYRIDGGAWTSYGEPFSLPAGEHAIGYRSVDRVGNVEVELTFFVTIGTPLPSIVVDLWWLIILVILSGLSLLALNESRRLSFITPIVILWARLRHNTILEQYTRGSIHGYLLANPGVHFEAMRRDMGLGVGTLAYHLWVLEREGMIRSWRDGQFRRYALSGHRIADAQPGLTDIERILLQNIHGRPGRTQRELAEEIGLSQPTISYHISKMAELGVVRVVREGLRKRYTADIRGIAHHLESLERAGAGQDLSKNGSRDGSS